MIPKTIHYCWLSDDPIPTEARECMASWRKHLPDWTIKCWNMHNFDVHSIPFVEEAVKARKWAFASDYIRLFALYTEGGVYLDTDVLVRKPMDFVLNNRVFSAIESCPHLIEQIERENLIDKNGDKRNPDDLIHGLQIQAAIIGSEKGHPFIKECMDYYKTRHFMVADDGIPIEQEISPIVYAKIAENYGFKYLNREQKLNEGIKLYSVEMFCPQPYLINKEQAIAVHCCNASWRTNQSQVRHIINNVKTWIKVIINKLGLRSERAIDELK